MTTMRPTRVTLPRLRPRPRDDHQPRRLVLSPAAWLKWQYLCHAGPTEVAGFGLSAATDPLYLEDVLVVRQQATPMTVSFDDTAVADLFDAMADAGVRPARFARVWLHTHPGAPVTPSWTDEDTFARAFRGCDWAVMAILGRTGRTSARLRFAAGPGGSVELPTAVDWAAWPAVAADAAWPLANRVAEWQREYMACVEQLPPLPFGGGLVESAAGRLPDTAALATEAVDQHVDPFPSGGLHEFN
jgi:hypothetical protein